jgi:RNA ligase (TIGR02306 family)
MSTFKVEVLPIERLEEHTNAERLEIAYLEGLDFPIVVQKGLYSTGELVVYFPLDSILLPELAGKLGLKSTRIKTMKLRGEISQGFCVPVADLLGVDADMVKAGDDLTEFTGVVKYEPPVINCGTANMTTLPNGLEIYDLENCERHSNVVEHLMDKEVVVTEKLEGSNITIHYDTDGLKVCSRRHTIVPIPGYEHTFCRTAREGGFDVLAQAWFNQVNKPIDLRGEIIGPGIQGNIYKLTKHQIRLFDVQVDYKYIDVDELYAHADNVAPVLFRGKLRDYLNGRTIREASNGQSVLAPVLREGIVIRPVVEEEFPHFGRLIIKQRSPEYLAKEK